VPQSIDTFQVAAVGHRLHFFGRPSGDTMNWSYSAQEWMIVRPDDDSPPQQETLTCHMCGKQLTYTVHSVLSATRRRTRWRPLWIGGLALLPLCFVLMVFGGGGELAFLSGFIGMMTALPAVFIGLYISSAEAGVTGHGASWPGATKHNVLF
jgi:hypothetical protein